MADSKLIFLISQPRSGSSLLQQLLMLHPDIDSTPESWQMLTLIHTYKPTDTSEGYNPNFATKNFIRDLESIPGGMKKFRDIIT